MLAGSAVSSRLTLTKGEVSVRPYPLQIRRRKRIATAIRIVSARASPPEMQSLTVSSETSRSRQSNPYSCGIVGKKVGLWENPFIKFDRLIRGITMVVAPIMKGLHIPAFCMKL